MQEAPSRVGGTAQPLPEPFFVLATQNPIEMEGTYPLPEAQLDRFLFKLPCITRRRRTRRDHRPHDPVARSASRK